MKILVTGATGFIGRRIAQALLEDKGVEVRVSGRNESKAEDLVSSGAEFIKADLSDFHQCEKICDGIEVIIHCAGLAGTWGEFDSYYTANVGSTENLLKAGIKLGVKRFINISSPSIYFEFKDQLDLKESDLPKDFSNAYAKTKFLGEKLVSQFHSDDFLTVSLRPRFVIGAGDSNIIPRMIRLQKSKMLYQIGDGENIVDVTSVTNVIEAVRLCMKASPKAMGEVYNITNGEPVKLYDFIDMVMNKVGAPTRRRRLPFWPLMILAQTNEFFAQLFAVKNEPRLLPISIAVLKQSMTLDIEKAKNKLGYRPIHSTQEGVDEFTEWWLKQSPPEEEMSE